MSKKAYIGVDGKARKVKKGYVGVENFVPRALPSGYTQLSYIESTGAQYFDTGFKANNNTRVVLSAYNASTSSGWTYGAWDSSSSNQFAFSCLNTYSFRYGSGGVQLTTLPVGDFEVDQNKNAYNLNGTSGTITAQTFSCSHTMYLFAINANGAVSSGKFTGRIKKCQIYDNGTLVRDYVPCKNASGVVGLYDMVNGTFGGSATTTAFVAGSSVQSAARKIKKAYIGIGGVARPCWSGGELAYYGKITALNQVKYNHAAASVGKYALYAGGQGESTAWFNDVDAYNESLTKTMPTALNQSRYDLCGARIGNYALFAGGNLPSGYSSKVETYDSSLTRSEAPALNQAEAELLSALSKNHVLFTCGAEVMGTVTAYDASLTKSTPERLGTLRKWGAGARSGEYALFAGGSTGSPKTAVVEAYNASLTRSVPTALSTARSDSCGASLGGYAIFAGGITGNQQTNVSAVVDIYDAALTRTTGTSLSVARDCIEATTIEGFAIFAGGRASTAYSKKVDVYDNSLTRTSNFNLNTARGYAKATTVGNYALFGGGYHYTAGSAADVSKVVDAFVVA